ncbi:MAG: class I SAM-dependent methyltransferase [Planctomycetota bacterium]|jgi:16S rRNA (guanine1516-N2)-methyltransferase|nr:class I SAM-dependent methyltransferase [Planctomycetota bacterium]
MTSSSNSNNPVMLSASAGEVCVDFVNGKLDYRRRFGGGKNQALSKAVGLHKATRQLRVLDATAGLGRDSFVLAYLGAKVLGLERHPQVYAALADGLQRAKQDIELSETLADNLEFIAKDAISLFDGDGQQLLSDFNPDVIYLDPMHPLPKKSALAKKEMRVFREVVGADDDQVRLFNSALRQDVSRVVVKRPAHAPPIADNFSHQIKGKTTRFDVYMRIS